MSNSPLIAKFEKLVKDLNTIIFGNDDQDVISDNIVKPTISKWLRSISTDFNNAINIAAATGAGANGWTAQLIVDASGKTQQQINDEVVLSVFDYTGLKNTAKVIDGQVAFVKKDGIAGKFRYDSTSTATHNGGTIIASNKGGNWVRLFTGKAQASWFGAISGQDATLALQKAIDSQLPFECEYQAVYKISSTLILKHGTDITGKKYSNNIDFNYCELQPQMSDYTLKIQSVGNYAADRATCVSQFGLKNVLLNLSAKAGSKAYRIGSSDNFVDSFYQSYIENFLVIAPDFTWGTVTTIENARHFRNVGVVHRMCGIDIRCDTGGMFTGDMEFKTCEFSGNASSRPFIIQAGMTGTNGQCRGITMRDCDVYGSSSKIYVDGNGQVGDIWIQDTQFDAPPYAVAGDIGLEVYAKGSGQLFQHHVNGNYFVGFNGAGLRIAKDEGGTGIMLDYRGNHYNNITGHVNSGLCAAYVLRMSNVDLSASFFDGLTNCQSAVNIDNAKSTKMLSADITNCTTVPYAVLVGGESKFFNLSNITTDTSNQVIVNDYSTATAAQKVVDNNMRVV